MSAITDELLNICEQEQLHLSNATQSYGLIMGLDKAGIITHIGANSVNFVNKEPQDLIGLQCIEILGQNFDLDGGIKTPKGNRRSVYGVKILEDKLFDIIIIQSQTGYILELQPSVTLEDNPHSQSSRLTSILNLSQSDKGIDELCSEIVDTIQEISGFEKVMIYQFQEDWSGEVIEEKNIKGVFPNYLGLRFPASDIPKIARDLYCSTPSRLIHDAHSNSVPIVSKTEDPIDLTYSDLRSVSPVHIEYLKNMNVIASLSFPIMVSDELWGLVSLHHPEARYLSIEVRNQCADVVTAFALALKSIATHDRMMTIDGLDRKIGTMINNVDFKSGQFADLLSVEEDLMELVDASGGAMVFGSTVYAFGKAPEQTAIETIDKWYLKKDSNQIISSHSLSSEIPESADWKEIVSGVMAVKTLYKGDDEGVRFYWFRPELPQVINWAGKPEKTIDEKAGEIRVAPRLSFEKWTEQTTAQSKFWNNADQMAAAKFRAMVLRAMIK